MNKKAIIILFITLPFICLVCRKDSEIDPKLPPATQEGKNTFGCKVNGKVWLPDIRKYTFYVIDELEANYYTYDSNMYIHAIYWTNDIQESIYLSLQTFSGEGKYYLRTKYKADHGYFFREIDSVSKIYYTNDTIGGQVEITKFDTINQIVSGIFFFNAVNDIGQIVDISDGRFDVIY